MFFHPEDAAIVKANAFENAVAVKQAVIEDRDLGVGLVEEFSVDVNLKRFRRRSFRRGGLLARNRVLSEASRRRRGFSVFRKHEKTSCVSKGNSSGETASSIVDASLCEAGPRVGWQPTARERSCQKAQTALSFFAECPLFVRFLTGLLGVG